MKITLLVGPGRWFLAHKDRLIAELKKRGHDIAFVSDHTQIQKGDVAVILSYGKMIEKEILALNRHNLVVHASALPKGRGSTPLTWQILEGKNEIPLTLFEVAEEMDSGPIYFQETLKFEGHELLHEMHDKMGEVTVSLILKFMDAYPKIQPKPQTGEPTYYKRRNPKDSETDMNKTLLELFNQFRTADNDKYPVFFRHKGHKYILKIEKETTHAD